MVTPIVALDGLLNRAQVNNALQELAELTGHCETLGPFFFPNGFSGTGTTVGRTIFATSATAVSFATGTNPRVDRAGRVIGARLTADGNRTAGTLTLRVRISGTGTDFDAGSVVLNGTNLAGSSTLLAFSSGLAFADGDTIGCEIVGAGFTPTTLNIRANLLVKYEAF